VETDEVLFQRWCTRADARALGQLFDRHAPQLLKLAIHLVGDAAAAEDLVQATFLAAIEQRERLDASRPIGPWLVGVLTNKAHEQRRAARRALDLERLAPRLADEDASAPLERRELHGEVARAIDELEDPYRQVLLLRLRHGLSAADIAHVLEREPGTVRVQLHRGLERLRKLLPSALVSSLVLALAAPRGLAALREQVVQAAQLTSPVAAGSLVVGGLLMSKFVVAAALAAVALVSWLLIGRAGDAAAPTASETRASTPLQVVDTPALPGGAAEQSRESSAARAAVADAAAQVGAYAEVVDALTFAPLSGARVSRFAARSTNVRELLRDRPECFRMGPQGRLVSLTGADWPSHVATSDEAYVGRAPLLALDTQGEGAALQTATSDAAGRAALDEAHSHELLEVALDGYATRHRARKPGERASRIELWPIRRVRGTCEVVRGNTPDQGFELAIGTFASRDEGNRNEGVCVHRVRTDAQGRFEVELAGSFAHARMLTPGWVVQPGSMQHQGAEEWRVRLQPAEQLRLVDAADGKPIEWIHAVARHPKQSWTVWTSLLHAPQGLLTLPNKFDRLGGDVLARFTLWAPGYRAREWVERAAPALEPAELRFEHEAAVTLHGVVLSQGEPVEGANVSALAHAANAPWEPAGRKYTALLDATTTHQGRFVLNVPTGVHLLEVRHAELAHTRVVEAPLAGELVIDLALQGSLNVRVVNRSGAPQVGHVVGLSANDQRTESRRTDEHGFARFEALGALKGTVFTAHETTDSSFVGEVSADFALADGERRELELVVRGAAGPRHARVHVTGTLDYSGWRARFGQQSWEPLNAAGVIPMDLSTDEWTGEVVALDGRRWSFGIPKDAEDGHVLELEGGTARYSGIVRTSSGKPLTGWTIVAQPWAACASGVAATPTCELRADGAFELTGLEGCEHRLRLHDAKGKPRAEFTPSRPPTAAGVACDIMLDPPRGKLELRGVVRNKNGEPIPGATLLFESNLRGADGVLRVLLDDDAFARSDDRGRYEIKLPRTPEHEISVYTKAGAPAALRERLLDDGSDEREHDLVVD
jgi:RNA polymerase sigma-70 factor (ECF subfamily)